MGSGGLRPSDVVRGTESTAAAYAIRKYGGPTKVIQRTATIGTTVSHLVRNNPRRVAWRAFNRSTNDIALGFYADITTTTGIPFPAATGVVEVDVEYEGEEVTWEVHAISTAAGSAVTILEVLRV